MKRYNYIYKIANNVNRKNYKNLTYINYGKKL